MVVARDSHLSSTPPPEPGCRGVIAEVGPPQPHFVSGEATWSGSEFEVSFPDSPGAQAQADHLPQLTLPDGLTSASSPEDGLSAELLEAQTEEPADTETEGPGSQTQVTPEPQPGL